MLYYIYSYYIIIICCQTYVLAFKVNLIPLPKLIFILFSLFSKLFLKFVFIYINKTEYITPPSHHHDRHTKYASIFFAVEFEMILLFFFYFLVLIIMSMFFVLFFYWIKLFFCLFDIKFNTFVRKKVNLRQ